VRRWILSLATVALTGCFLTARTDVRTYYVLHPDGVPTQAPQGPILGLVQVRNLDAAAVYEKFQIVVRQSPYQLRYSDVSVWAVKPSDMFSDQIAKALIETNSFAGVTRELFEARPEFFIGGELEALELYDSEDVWFAHLAITLYLSRFDDGRRIWSMRFDERSPVSTRSFAHGVRVLSELVGLAAGQMVAELGSLDLPRTTVAEPHDPVMPTRPKLLPERRDREPIFVPEGDRTDEPGGPPPSLTPLPGEEEPRP
jgi:ABC-type uncharacterized transport system auxiliary subunit